MGLAHQVGVSEYRGTLFGGRFSRGFYSFWGITGVPYYWKHPGGGNYNQFWVADVASRPGCTSNATMTYYWQSIHTLTGIDYMLCLEASSMHGCTAVNISAGEILIDPVAPVQAGEQVLLTWQCKGPSNVKISLCRGGPCWYGGGSSNFHWVANLDSSEDCATPSFAWSSWHTLVGADDYLFCLEDYEAWSVRGCTAVNISAGEILIDPVAPFHAGEQVLLTWQCKGPSNVKISLCRGGPCWYGGGSSNFHWVANLDSSEGCATPSFAWSSSHVLVGADDYLFCLEDYEAWSVRGCTAVNISAGEILIDPVASFHAGEQVLLTWQCKGPSNVKISLCRGGPCWYGGGSSNFHWVANLDSSEDCATPSFAWSSWHTLVGADDYLFCLEDYDAWSVRGCTAVNLSAGEILIDPVAPFHAGEQVLLTWQCKGPSSVKISLCRGGPCWYGGGSSNFHWVANLDSSEGCATPSFAWSSSHMLVGADDYRFCLEDYEAWSVRGCTAVNISAGEILIDPVAPFRAGEQVLLTWQCKGPSNVKISLCRGGPCWYGGGSSNFNWVANLDSSEDCATPSFSWRSPHSLEGGFDSLLCIEDAEVTGALSVRGCTALNVSAGEVSVSPIAAIEAGQLVQISWQCNGPDSVSISLCHGGACVFGGGSSDPHWVANLDSWEDCATPSYSWSSPSSLGSGDDYMLCVQDTEAPSVRGCVSLNVSAGGSPFPDPGPGSITLGAISSFTAGQVVQLLWQCNGPSYVRLSLCKGGQCRYGGGSYNQHWLSDVDSYESCSAPSFAWPSIHSLASSTDYQFCVEDRSDPSVRGCAAVNISAGEILIDPVAPFHAGEQVLLTWQCKGPSNVKISLCRGGPCWYGGGSSNFHWVANLDSSEGCATPSFAWSSWHMLVGADDYLLCLEDYEAWSVRGCTAVNISAGEILIDPVAPFHAGEQVLLTWQCKGPSNVKISLCRGGPCWYGGGSSNFHWVANLDSSEGCATPSFAWSSWHTLVGADDYRFCLEDYEAWSVRGCTAVNISAGEILIDPVAPFRAGEQVLLTWQCKGPSNVKISLCRGGPCWYGGGSSNFHWVTNLDSSEDCATPSFAWSSWHTLVGADDYLFCLEDYEAWSVRGCTAVIISAGEILIDPVADFRAGEQVSISWQCFGPSSVKISLCRGGPCWYAGGSSNFYWVANVDSSEVCSAPLLTWSSPHVLDSSDDYFFCLEDTEASSVRECAAVKISAGKILIDAVAPFQAGAMVSVSWQCLGPSKVKISLCRGGPCRYGGGSSNFNWVANLDSSEDCATPSFSWRSPHSLEGGVDSLLCVEDAEVTGALSVRGCTALNVSMGEVSVRPIAAFEPGQLVQISWQCNGPDTVSVSLCHGGACGSSDPHWVANLHSRAYCATPMFFWFSPSSLGSGDDYMVCVQDTEAPSVRGCSDVQVLADGIYTQPLLPFHAGDNVQISFKCIAQSSVHLGISLCLGGPCQYGEANPFWVADVTLRSCHLSSYRWESMSWLGSSDGYMFCFTDTEASLQSVCEAVSISAAEISIDPIAPFHAGEKALLAWKCKGTRHVAVSLCQGGPCEHGETWNRRWVGDVFANVTCAPASWPSLHGLAGGNDYMFCFTDVLSPVQECAPAVISASEISVAPLAAVYAGQELPISWTCLGPDHVSIALCQGEPCWYGNYSLSWVSDVARYEFCGRDNNGTYSWDSLKSLASGEYLVCLQDVESSFARGCAAVNISAGEILIDPVAPFHAGEQVLLTWQCKGPSNVKISLCRGGPCRYGGGSSNFHWVANLDSSEGCATPSFAWSSSHALVGADDYSFCLEDAEASSVRECTAVNISAGEILIAPIAQFYPGMEVVIFWQCFGPSSVLISLCRGGPCLSTESASLERHNDLNWVKALGSHHFCYKGMFTWSSAHVFEDGGDDYLICIESTSAPSVRGCTPVGIRMGEILFDPIQPIMAGEPVAISWQCIGTQHVSISLCSGGPCAYRDRAAPYWVADLVFQADCATGRYVDQRRFSSPFIWSGGSDDFVICLTDQLAPAVRACRNVIVNPNVYFVSSLAVALGICLLCAGRYAYKVRRKCATRPPPATSGGTPSDLHSVRADPGGPTRSILRRTSVTADPNFKPLQASASKLGGSWETLFRSQVFGWTLVA